MITIAYSTFDERSAYAARAHRIRSEAVAGLIRNIGRWVSAAAR